MLHLAQGYSSHSNSTVYGKPLRTGSKIQLHLVITYICDMILIHKSRERGKLPSSRNHASVGVQCGLSLGARTFWRPWLIASWVRHQEPQQSKQGKPTEVIYIPLSERSRWWNEKICTFQSQTADLVYAKPSCYTAGMVHMLAGKRHLQIPSPVLHLANYTPVTEKGSPTS